MSIRQSLRSTTALRHLRQRPLLSALPRSFRLRSLALSSAQCPRCFSLSSMTDLKFLADAQSSSPTKKPINISGIKHDGSTRRFYDSVSITYRLPDGQQQGGWAVTLAGRHIETPHHHSFILPTQRLALAIALEWESQLTFIKYTTMPLTNLALLAIDKIRPDKESFLDKFNPSIALDNTLLRVEDPTSLAKLQKKHWDPLLRHLSKSHDIDLEPTLDFSPPASPHASRLRHVLSMQDEWTLAALDSITSISKSVIIALCTLDGELSLEGAYEACRVEENYQMRLYGEVRGMYGHTIDIEYTKMVIAAARTLMNLIRPVGEEALIVEAA